MDLRYNILVKKNWTEKFDLNFKLRLKNLAAEVQKSFEYILNTQNKHKNTHLHCLNPARSRKTNKVF